MYKILKAEELADKIYLMDVEAPRVAKHCEPGQFVIVKMDDKGERIPLTICDYDREAGTITIVFQIVGASTQKMAELKAGDSFRDFTGPLGCASEFVSEDLETLKNKKMLFVAGGVGAAPVYPQVKWLREKGIDADVIVGCKTKNMLILEKEMEEVAGNLYICTDDGSYGQVKWLREKGIDADVIVGCKTKNMLILEKEMEEVAGNLYICTDDGSYGHAGMVTSMIEKLVKEEGKKYDVCVAIGPMIMMKFVCLLTKQLELPTIVSMNPIMVDGTGMCGAVVFR